MEKKKRNTKGSTNLDTDYLPSDAESSDTALQIDINDDQSKAASELNASSPSTIGSTRLSNPRFRDDISTGGESEKKESKRSGRKSARSSKRRLIALESDSGEDFSEEETNPPRRKLPKRMAALIKKAGDYAAAEYGCDISGDTLDINRLSEFGVNEDSLEMMHLTRRAATRSQLPDLPSTSSSMKRGASQSKENDPEMEFLEDREDRNKLTGKTGGLDDSNTTLSEENTDNNCWVCHKGGEDPPMAPDIVLLCLACPRVYHKNCVQLVNLPEDDWLCLECEAQLMFENLITMPKLWQAVSLDTLKKMLSFLIDRLSELTCAAPFCQPVNFDEAPDYLDYIFKPMDLSTLRKNIKSGEYRSPHAFLADFKWIVHNCMVFNGNSSPLTASVKNLHRGCRREVTEMIACPSCYFSKVKFQTDTIPDPDWFVRPCPIIHPLVWVRLKHFPLWPAKVIRIDGDSLLARFFGDYDTNTVPVGSVYMHAVTGFSKDKVISSRSEKNAHFMIGYEEFNRHLHYIIKQYPLFKLPPTKVGFSMETVDKYYTHLGLPKRMRAATEPSQADIEAEQVTSYHVKRISDMKLVASPDKKTPLNTSDTDPNSLAADTNDKEAECESSKEDKSTRSNQADNTNERGNEPSEKGSTTPLPNEPGKNKLTTEDEEQPMDVDVESNKSLPPNQKDKDSQLMEVSPNETSVEIKADSSTSTELVTNLFSKWEEKMNAFMDNMRETMMLSMRSSNTCHQSATPLLVNIQSSSTSTDGNQSKIASEMPLSCSVGPAELSPISQSNLMSLPLGKALSLLANQVSNPPPPVTENNPEIAGSADKVVHDQSQVIDLTNNDSFSSQTGPPLSPEKSASKGRAQSEYTEPDDALTATCSRSTSASIKALQSHEVAKLRREMRRCEILSAVEKLELSWELENRLLELREQFEAEKSRLFEEARRVWENEVISLVDAVKKKQWCSYCGRVAFYYCCWNTCYCNSECQERHWASHMNLCAQAKRPAQPAGFRS